MASLKDMRVRIASTKATQKITKAMQMVAASKLRRAQSAAEAARPYAEKMDAVISNIASAAAGSPGAPALLTGTGSDQVHLLLVCTGERGLSGAFNSSIVRLARERAYSLINQGKEVKISTCARFARSASPMPKTLPKRFWRASTPASSTSARCSIRASNPWLRRCRPPSRSFRWWWKSRHRMPDRPRLTSTSRKKTRS